MSYSTDKPYPSTIGAMVELVESLPPESNIRQQRDRYKAALEDVMVHAELGTCNPSQIIADLFDIARKALEEK